MKLGYISDLHIDFNEQFDILNTLVNEIKNQKIEMLLIGGDISNSTKKTLEFVLEVEAKTSVQIHYIFGNHDYYELNKDFHSDRAIQNTFPLTIGDYGIIADTGWYDYTWYTPGFGNINKLMRGKTTTGGTWPDHRFIKWPEDANGDITGRWFAKHSINELKRQNDLLDSQGTKRKIVMTHMIPHQDFLVTNWDYIEGNVFFGSSHLSEFIDSIKPDITFFGHTHFSYDKMRNGSWCICSPLGYNFEWTSNNIRYEIGRRLVVIDL